MDIVEKENPLFYRVIRPLVMFLFKLCYRPFILGKENIPKSGPIVLVGASHKHNFDALSLMATTKRCVHFLAKDELYQGAKKVIFKNMGIIPVNRRTKDGKALQSAISFLKKGYAIGIFPEGTFNKSKEKILPFKIGAVKMAHDTNTKLVVCTIEGGYHLFKKGLKITVYPPISVKEEDLTQENDRLMEYVKERLPGKEKEI